MRFIPAARRDDTLRARPAARARDATLRPAARSSSWRRTSSRCRPSRRSSRPFATLSTTSTATPTATAPTCAPPWPRATSAATTRSRSATVRASCSCCSATRCSSPATRSCSPSRPSSSTPTCACGTRRAPSPCRSSTSPTTSTAWPRRSRRARACSSSATPTTRRGPTCPTPPSRRLVDAVPDDVLIVLDEAYNEFVTASDAQESLAIEREHENVVVLRTFSKIYGLCGLRVGYGLCASEIKRALDKVRQPFNVNRLAQAAALEALKHQDQVTERAAHERRGARLHGRAAGADGPRHRPERGELHARGRARPDRARRSTSSRSCSRRARSCATGTAWDVPGWARVSVGTREETDFFLERLAALLPAGASVEGRSS